MVQILGWFSDEVETQGCIEGCLGEILGEIEKALSGERR
jgi:hypothetical protein